MKAIPLHGKNARGRVSWVSESKYGLVMAYRWHVLEGQHPNGTVYGPYAQATIRLADGRYTKIYMHDLIMGCAGVDHRNGYGLDNTGPNLRKATPVENARNRGSDRRVTSSFKGVSWDSDRRKWCAYITVDRKSRNLGRFADEVAAARAYDARAAEAFGEFARLNFPLTSKVVPDVV